LGRNIGGRRGGDESTRDVKEKKEEDEGKRKSYFPLNLTSLYYYTREPG
jgi:hypothetical protein